jgi:hypothetical protein
MKLWAPKKPNEAGISTRSPNQQAGKPATLSRGHLNDLTAALGQQMFFWGRDVLAREGNLLVKYGFARTESPGLKGTSCYRKAWRSGYIELHGACAGWYPTDPESTPGFLFIRTDRRCYAHHETEAVIPGRYDYEKLSSGDLSMLSQAGSIFAGWLANYERWIERHIGPEHRSECYSMFSKLPAGKPWLRPDLALRWLQRCAAGDASLPRARLWRTKADDGPDETNPRLRLIKDRKRSQLAVI